MKKRSTGRSRRRPREVAQPTTMKFVFAGWLGGRPRIACESRADGSPAHGEAFRVYGRSRRRRGVARSSQRRSRTGNNANEAQLSSSARCGTARIALKRRADGPPAPPARLLALRTFPRGCRPTRAALGGGAGGEAMSPGRSPLCGEERCCCCDQYAGYRGRELRSLNFDVLLTLLPRRRTIYW